MINYFCRKIMMRQDNSLILKRGNNHDKYYKSEYNDLTKKWSPLAYCMHFTRPLFTIGILIILLWFIYLVYQLSKIHLNKGNDLQVLLSLVPTLLLLFGSWYKLHLFWDFEKEKTEKEILEAILQHMKPRHSEMSTA